MTRRLEVMTLVLFAAGGALDAAAGVPETWTFEEETSGEDVHWVSPTAVRADAAFYHSTLEITGVWATALLFGFPVEVEVTDQIPPEFQNSVSCALGPAPMMLFDQSIAFPEPPEPPAVAADMTVTLNADGFGVVDAINVILGDYDLGFGVVPIVGLRMAGSVTVEPLGVATCPADVDESGDVGFADLLALLGAWGPCECCRPDLDLNADVGFSDLLLLLGDWGGCP